MDKSETSKKVVLVTGATSGIGLACAERLADAGWRVFGTGRAVSEHKTSRGVEMIRMNVDDEESVNAGVETVLSKAGRLNAVVNNAGFPVMGAVEDTSIEEAKGPNLKRISSEFYGCVEQPCLLCALQEAAISSI